MRTSASYRVHRRTGGEATYWAGRSFERYPLTAVDRVGEEVSLTYGDCEIDDQGWFEDGGCALPGEIQHRPIRRNNPNVYREVNGSGGGCTVRRVRGVPAVRRDGLEVYTGGWEIRLYATSHAQERRLLKALRPLNGPGDADDRLPPPVIDLSRGLAACRT